MSWIEKARLSAAAQAVRELRNGTTVGLGSGTTVLKALDLAAERIKKEHLNISWVPTSYQMEIAAKRLGLKTTTLSEDTELDLAIDGADQVQWRSLDLVKGGGAALLREKIVDSTTKKLVIIIHEKLKEIPGVLETGLFLEMCDTAYVGRKDGKVDILRRS